MNHHGSKPRIQPLDEQLLDLATYYPQLKGPLGVDEGRGEFLMRTVARSTPPPGAGAILDFDARWRTIAAIERLAANFCMHLWDYGRIELVPYDVEAKLKLAAKHADYLPVSAITQTAELRKEARRLLRPSRYVSTGHRCLTPTCKGVYRGDVERPRTPIVCSECKDTVEYERWKVWPKRGQYVTAKHAARLLGCTVQAIWTKASRGRWKRMKINGETRYLLDDIHGAE